MEQARLIFIEHEQIQLALTDKQLLNKSSLLLSFQTCHNLFK